MLKMSHNFINLGTKLYLNIIPVIFSIGVIHFYFSPHPVLIVKSDYKNKNIKIVKIIEATGIHTSYENILHNGLICLHGQGHSINRQNYSPVTGEILIKISEDLPVEKDGREDNTYSDKFNNDCKRCNVYSTIFYKNIFGFRESKTYSWNNPNSS
jgi:hypothetical protein